VKTISGKAFARLLEQRGWQLVRINGSHHIYLKKGNPARISIPIHGNTTLKIGLLKQLMNIANITSDEL